MLFINIFLLHTEEETGKVRKNSVKQIFLKWKNRNFKIGKISPHIFFIMHSTIPRTEVSIRAQASYENITVLSHLKCKATHFLEGHDWGECAVFTVISAK